MCANGSPPPSSRKGEALSGIVANTSADLYAIPARASLGQDDEARDKLLANVPAQATAALVVRLGALRRNYAKLRTLAKGAETAGVVKANAYGLGAEAMRSRAFKGRMPDLLCRHFCRGRNASRSIL